MHASALQGLVQHVDNIGAATWTDSLKTVKRDGVLVINGITTGPNRRDRSAAHLRGTDGHPRHHCGHAREMRATVQFVIRNNITPEVGAVAPMTEACEAIRKMIEGRTQGKTFFTR